MFFRYRLIVAAAQDPTRYREFFRRALKKDVVELYELGHRKGHFVPEKVNVEQPGSWGRFFTGSAPSTDLEGNQGFSFRWGALNPPSHKVFFRPTADGKLVPVEDAHFIQANFGPPAGNKPVKVYVTLPPVFIRNICSAVSRVQFMLNLNPSSGFESPSGIILKWRKRSIRLP